MITQPALTTEDAQSMLAAAVAEAERQSWAVSIAVADEGGHLLAFIRLPGANLASVQIAQAKARTAVMMRRETRLVEDMINGGRHSFLSAPDLEGLLEGGVPLFVSGHCVGAVGVSGVQAAQDATVARAGVAAIAVA